VADPCRRGSAYADELLALVKEDELVERVLDVQRLNDAVLVDLVNLEPSRDRLVEADVLDGRALRVEREDREPGEGARLPELERQGLRGCRECLHVGESRAHPRGLTLFEPLVHAQRQVKRSLVETRHRFGTTA
jgi:hypothetical protein